MKKALIIGATGTIGSAVMKAFTDAGFETEGVSRKTNPALDIDQTESVDRFWANGSTFDVIVCAAGNASYGTLDELGEDSYRQSFNSKLLGQVRVVRRGLKKLNPDGVIILTGGMQAYNPWPGTSAVAMVNAGLEGFVKAITREINDGRQVCIFHPPLVAETARLMGMNSSVFPAVTDVAQVYLRRALHASGYLVMFLEGFGPKNS
jgi:NAD(P)-dependent dehydrogenase (short-subunit alcohol dehydrogenase family)